jgi:hypothetical protein
MTVGFRDRDGLSGVRGSLSIPGMEEHTGSVAYDRTTAAACGDSHRRTSRGVTP